MNTFSLQFFDLALIYQNIHASLNCRKASIFSLDALRAKIESFSPKKLSHLSGVETKTFKLKNFYCIGYPIGNGQSSSYIYMYIYILEVYRSIGVPHPDPQISA